MNISNSCSYSKENSWIRNDIINNFKQRSGRYCKKGTSLEKSGLLTKVITETIKNEAKEQKGRLLSAILLGILTTRILGNAFSGRGVIIGGE